jgi:hypothetical protein
MDLFETQKYRRYPNVLDVESIASNFFRYHLHFHPAIKNKKKFSSCPFAS